MDILLNNSSSLPLGSAYLPPNMHAAVLGCLQKQAAEILSAEGWVAFEMPRTAAVAHEASHAVVGTAVGLEIVETRIFQRKVKTPDLSVRIWCGQTDEKNAQWSFNENTPTADILARVCFWIAGKAGEMLFSSEDHRTASSLDEIALAQFVSASLFKERRGEFASVDNPRKLFNNLWQQVGLILKANAGVTHDLMAKLDRKERVHGKLLNACLRRVSRIGTN